MSVWGIQKTQMIDYVLPASVQHEPVMLVLPEAYILTTSALVFLGFKKGGHELPKLPKLEVTFDYSDIGGEKHQVRFDAVLHPVIISGKKMDCYLDFTRRD